MSFRDIVIIAFRNLKAGKRNVYKIIIGTGFAFALAYCFVIVANYFSDYKENFWETYRESCYYYDIFDEKILVNNIDSIIEKSKENKENYGANEYSLLFDVIPNGWENSITAEELIVKLEDTKYTPCNYYINDRKIYEDIKFPYATIPLAYYSDENNIFPEYMYDENNALEYVGNYPSNPGELLVDDYILDVLGINREYDSKDIIGKKISLLKKNLDNNTEEIFLENYVIVGILSVDELGKREEETSHDYHFEHIYINLKNEDKEHFFVINGSARYYFDSYDEYIENCKYSDEILNLMKETENVSDWEYYLTYKGMEICIINWLVSNVGKLVAGLGIIVIVLIFLSLFYTIRFYNIRNIKYMKMLSCIGMKKKDRKKVYNMEFFVIFLASEAVAIYMSALFFIVFRYIVVKLLLFEVRIDMTIILNMILASGVIFFVCNVLMGRHTISIDRLE